MIAEDVIIVKELVAKVIRAQGNIEIILDTERQTTGGFVFKDSVGFTVARIDSSGNLHIKGDIIKDL